MPWTEPRFSRGEVDRAGDDLFGGHGWQGHSDTVSKIEAINHTFEVIGNWRSSHSYPLQWARMTLEQRAKKVCSHPLIVQRLKRLRSIGDKLRGTPAMKLSRMQDIGGCPGFHF